jgi:hypothetical protein
LKYVLVCTFVYFSTGKQCNSNNLGGNVTINLKKNNKIRPSLMKSLL